MTAFQTWDELDARPIPAWYSAAKFGIFIHWGVFSVPAWRTLSNEQFGSYAEWYYASVYGPYRNADGDFHQRMYGDATYRDFVQNFRAELFDPTAWAGLFARAGARYVVLTSKHHDGFCMWPTANRNKHEWNAGEVGPRRDILGELTQAVRERGMRMGLYYSMIEWETHRSHRVNGGFFIPQRDAERFGIDEDKYPDEILIPQWKELNERYSPSVIYTDGGEWDLSEEYSHARELLQWLYTQAPNRADVVVNDRMFKGMPGRHGDVFSTEYQDIDGFGTRHPWEESRGIGGSYGFNRAESIEDYATARQLVTLLAQTVSAGGNLLLNVGPTADGRIPVIQQERLVQIGEWLDLHGKAIYDTLPTSEWKTAENQEAWLTHNPKESVVYCLVDADLYRAGESVTILMPLGRSILKVEDDTSGQKLDISIHGSTLKCSAPESGAHECPGVIRIFYA